MGETINWNYKWLATPTTTTTRKITATTTTRRKESTHQQTHTINKNE